MSRLGRTFFWRATPQRPDVGLTDTEWQAWLAVAGAAAQVLALPPLHPMERDEIASAFHAVQFRLLARPAQRALQAAGLATMPPPCCHAQEITGNHASRERDGWDGCCHEHNPDERPGL